MFCGTGARGIDVYGAGIAGGFDADGDIGGGEMASEFFGPFDEDNGIAAEDFVEAEGGKLAGFVEAIEVDVIEADGVAIFVDEGESGAGDFVGSSRPEAFGDAFGKGGFPCSEVASEEDEAGGMESRGERFAEGDHFFFGGRVEGFGHESSAMAWGR
jgi:hypothetical protein